MRGMTGYHVAASPVAAFPTTPAEELVARAASQSSPRPADLRCSPAWLPNGRRRESVSAQLPAVSPGWLQATAPLGACSLARRDPMPFSEGPMP